MFKPKQKPLSWEELKARLIMLKGEPLSFIYDWGFYGRNLYYWLTHPWMLFWELPQDLWLSLKWFWQRGRRGYSDNDAWNLSSFLCSWLPQALKQIAGGKSHPSTLTAKQWSRILTEMAKGFEAGRKINEIEWESKTEYRKLERKLNRSLEMFNKWFLHLWD